VNMDHFKEADRGFSLKRDGELDMRYDRSVWMSAADRLARATYDELMMIFEKFTDFWQKYSWDIVKNLMVAKKKKPFTTTQELRERAKANWINDKKLAVIFQAIRIQVNWELEELEKFLQSFTNFLISWGRCLVMTYHSIEDRMVKYAFKDLVEQWIWALVNKKVIAPNRQEVKKNKAARSAKLRIFEKI
jgi:16S rRNA (cytosine1402-N4)-methyltransferase